MTQNKLTLREAQPWAGTDTQTLILTASLASRAADNDPIDLAIMAALKNPSVLKSYQQEKYVPFDPVDKRTEATIKDTSGKAFRATKGAPQVILGLAKLSGADLEKAQEVVNGFASRGYRPLVWQTPRAMVHGHSWEFPRCWTRPDRIPKVPSPALVNTASR